MEKNNCNVLNTLAASITNLYNQELSGEYVLYLSTYAIKGLPGAVVFGDVNFKSVSEKCWASSEEVINKLLMEDEGYVEKIGLFNNEVFYYLLLSVDGDVPKVDFCISSMIFGRSNGKILTAYMEENDLWHLKVHCWYNELDGFYGTMQECIAKIDQVLNEMDSPYDSMKLGYYDIYEDRINRPLEVEVSAEGIRVNDWFGI